MMTTRAILEAVVGRGYNATVTLHSDGTVSIRATDRAGLLCQTTADDELLAATALWNQLGFTPPLEIPPTIAAGKPRAANGHVPPVPVAENGKLRSSVSGTKSVSSGADDKNGDGACAAMGRAATFPTVLEATGDA